MNAITDFLNLDFRLVFAGIFSFLAGLTAILSLLEKVSGHLGIELRFLRKKKEDHELLLSTAKKLEQANQKHDQDVRELTGHNRQIEENLDKLTKMFVEKNINDMRWEIINTAEKIANHHRISEEAYHHAFHTYDEYEKIIKENDLVNSEIDISIEIIKRSYQQTRKKKEESGVL